MLPGSSSWWRDNAAASTVAGMQCVQQPGGGKRPISHLAYDAKGAVWARAEQHVGWLDVAVNQTQRVQVLQAACNIRKQLQCRAMAAPSVASKHYDK